MAEDDAWADLGGGNRATEELPVDLEQTQPTVAGVTTCRHCGQALEEYQSKASVGGDKTTAWRHAETKFRGCFPMSRQTVAAP